MRRGRKMLAASDLRRELLDRLALKVGDLVVKRGSGGREGVSIVSLSDGFLGRIAKLSDGDSSHITRLRRFTR